MKKIKLYLYPDAKPHDSDSTDFCVNTVPFSEKGISEHCTLVEPAVADYFYMGQINNDRGILLNSSPDNYPYFRGNEDRHICDIEGEGGFEAANRAPLPEWLHGSIITTVGPIKKYSNIKYLFTRPNSPILMSDIIKNRKEEFQFPEGNSFGLCAYMNHKIRALCVYALHNSDFEKELHVKRKWQALAKVGSDTQEQYINTMINNSISLCPRGSGVNSVRFYETCYYNRVPVMISDYDHILFAEDTHDTSFCFRICQENMTPEYLHGELGKIYNTSNEELKKRADSAKDYFETAVRSYFEDPTLYFIKWLENKKN
jgi:hypothetical protein